MVADKILHIIYYQNLLQATDCTYYFGNCRILKKVRKSNSYRKMKIIQEEHAKIKDNKKHWIKMTKSKILKRINILKVINIPVQPATSRTHIMR